MEFAVIIAILISTGFFYKELAEVVNNKKTGWAWFPTVTMGFITLVLIKIYEAGIL